MKWPWSKPKGPPPIYVFKPWVGSTKGFHLERTAAHPRGRRQVDLMIGSSYTFFPENRAPVDDLTISFTGHDSSFMLTFDADEARKMAKYIERHFGLGRPTAYGVL